jgi:hypothetical protein
MPLRDVRSLVGHNAVRLEASDHTGVANCPARCRNYFYLKRRDERTPRSFIWRRYPCARQRSTYLGSPWARCSRHIGDRPKTFGFPTPCFAAIRQGYLLGAFGSPARSLISSLYAASSDGTQKDSRNFELVASL